MPKHVLRYERFHGKRPANKATRIRHMQERIAKREGKELEYGS